VARAAPEKQLMKQLWHAVSLLLFGTLLARFKPLAADLSYMHTGGGKGKKGEHMSSISSGLAVRPIKSALALVAALALLALAAPAASAQTAERCFSETGFCISGRIREFWEQNGGLAVFGFPIGPQQEEQIEDRTLQAQWFERTRLELHPENERPYDVLLGRIAVNVLDQQGRDWFGFPRGEARDGCRYFAETGHNVCGQIWAAWQASGLEFDGRSGTSFEESLALFGLPLSDEQTETIEGREYTVQWFERARFELHPENQPPYNVLLGRLGAEARAGQNRYVLPGSAVFPEGVAFQPASGDFFVSSTSDGTIFRGNVAGGAARPFLAGGADDRTTAIGLKVDEGRLYVAGGGTGRLWIYDTNSRNLIARFETARRPTFINDVAVGPAGTAYFTDSQSPVLYRVFTDGSGQLAFEEWLDFTGTPLVYQQGFNANGITISSDGKFLIVVQSNTGKLFRIEIANKAVREINLGGETVTNGDGILLDVRTLYVARNRNGEIVKIQLAEDLGSGVVVGRTVDPSLAYPTTIAKAGERLLVVNSQFDKRGEGLTPALPFTVSSIPAP
jgi:Cu-Zn family superoxide dismutase